MASSRAKPWDDRELDALEGLKTIMFLLCTISQTSFYLVETNLINLLNVFSLLRMLPVSTFVQANLGMESFVFLSVFIMMHRCFQIMDSKNGNILSFLDIIKILLRKFYRLAVPYYLMWVILWCITSRIGKGPTWSNTNVTFGDCGSYWADTLFFAGNLFPNEMQPYQGCFQ